MKHILQRILFSASASLLMLGAAPTLFADGESCNASSLQGSYGYTVTGTINPGAVPALPPGPFAAVGRLTFDGAGNLATVRTLSANGAILQGDMGAGKYMVKAECTGSFYVTIATPNGTVQLSLDLVLDDSNNELRAIVTNQGYILTLQGRKQLPNNSNH